MIQEPRGYFVIVITPVTVSYRNTLLVASQLRMRRPGLLFMNLVLMFFGHSSINALYCSLYDSKSIILYIYIWDSFHENGPSFIIIKCYKIAMYLNRNNFRTVKAINFLLSALHTTPFLYGKIHFGVLHLLRARIATSDTPPGSNTT